MRELADEEVALISGGEENTVEPAEPQGFFGSLLRSFTAFLYSIGAGGPAVTAPPTGGTGPRG